MTRIKAWTRRWIDGHPDQADRVINLVIVLISVVVVVVCYGLLLLLDEWLPARLIPWIPFART